MIALKYGCFSCDLVSMVPQSIREKPLRDTTWEPNEERKGENTRYEIMPGSPVEISRSERRLASDNTHARGVRFPEDYWHLLFDGPEILQNGQKLSSGNVVQYPQEPRFPDVAIVPGCLPDRSHARSMDSRWINGLYSVSAV
jgi:hypothetical protein